MKRHTAFAALFTIALATAGAANAQYAPRHDLDRDGIANRYDHDRDGDGIRNRRDPNPNVRNHVRPRHVNRFGPYGDLDRDGVQNRFDRDRDGDGVANARDRRPDDRRYS